MFIVGDELTKRFSRRSSEYDIFYRHMRHAFTAFSHSIILLLDGSDWCVDIPKADDCRLTDKFSFNTHIELFYKHNCNTRFTLNIEFEHVSGSYYTIFVPTANRKFDFFLDGTHLDENIVQGSELLLCFEAEFPPQIPSEINTF